MTQGRYAPYVICHMRTKKDRRCFDHTTTRRWGQCPLLVKQTVDNLAPVVYKAVEEVGKAEPLTSLLKKEPRKPPVRTSYRDEDF